MSVTICYYTNIYVDWTFEICAQLYIYVDRHWKELMDKTGQKFEMNPDTCTLQNIFAMELHRFQDKIAEIVNCAIKELAIERVKMQRSCFRRRLNFHDVELPSAFGRCCQSD